MPERFVRINRQGAEIFSVHLNPNEQAVSTTDGADGSDVVIELAEVEPKPAPKRKAPAKKKTVAKKPAAKKPAAKKPAAAKKTTAKK
jgi:hypothetical protein